MKNRIVKNISKLFKRKEMGEKNNILEEISKEEKEFLLIKEEAIEDELNQTFENDEDEDEDI